MDKNTEKELERLFTRVENLNIGFIQHFDGVIDEKLCKKFIKKFKEMDKKGLTVQGALGSDRHINLDKKSSMDINLAEKYDDELDELFNTIGQIIMDCVFSYLINVGWFGISYAGFTRWNIAKYVPKKHLPQFPDTLALATIRLRKYNKNVDGYFVPHYDSQGDLHRRVVAVIVYLNDVKYGGETIFPILKTRIKPRAGRIAIFPSYFTHMHYGNTSPHDKYVIVGHIEERRDYLKKQKEKE